MNRSGKADDRSSIIRLYVDQKYLLINSLVIFLNFLIFILDISVQIKLVVLSILMGIPMAFLYFRDRDLFSPIGFLGIAYLIGWLGPSLDLVLRHQQTEGLLLGQGLDYLVLPLIAANFGILALGWGYTSGLGRVVVGWIPTPKNQLDQQRARRAISILFFLGLCFFVLFVISTGGIPNSLSAISAKRRPPSEYLRWGTELIYIAAILSVIDHLYAEDSLVSTRGIRTATISLFAVLLPIYSSQRGTLFSLAILAIVIYHYSVRKLRISRVLLFIPIFVFFSNIMLAFRRASWQGGQVLAQLAPMSVDSVTSFFGADTTGITIFAHLFHKVPDEISFQFGRTMIKWIVFPIPRSYWSEKPRNLGQVLGEQIYQQGIGVVGAGTPPSVMGELYLNFSLPGMIVGMFLCGVILRSGFLYIRKGQTTNLLAISLYAVFVTRVAISILGIDVTMIILDSLRWYIPLVAGVIYSSTSRS